MRASRGHAAPRVLAMLALVVIAAGALLWRAVREPAATPPPHDASARPAPIIADAAPAPPPRRPDAADEPAVTSLDEAAAKARDDAFATLRASGSANEPWAEQGTALLGATADEASGSSDLGCFVAGCGGVFVFASERDYAQRRAAIEASAAYRAWTGGKRWTEPERHADGHVIVGLLLYRPD